MVQRNIALLAYLSLQMSSVSQHDQYHSETSISDIGQIRSQRYPMSRSVP